MCSIIVCESVCICVVVTGVVQQNDHVVPSQAVVRFQHSRVPPRVQGVNMSVLVSILS